MFGHPGVSVGQVSSAYPLQLLRNGPTPKTEPNSPSAPDVHVDEHADTHGKVMGIAYSIIAKLRKGVLMTICAKLFSTMHKCRIYGPYKRNL